MICVDATVWAAFFRGRDERLGAHLRDLLDRDEVALPSPVRVELLVRASPSQSLRLGRVLSALPLLHPTSTTWDRIETWAIEAARRGDRFCVADLLTAGIAVDARAQLWSLDADFERMRTLGWLRLHRASLSP